MWGGEEREIVGSWGLRAKGTLSLQQQQWELFNCQELRSMVEDNYNIYRQADKATWVQNYTVRDKGILSLLEK